MVHISTLTENDLDECVNIINLNYGKDYVDIFKKEFLESFKDSWIIPKYIL